MVPVRLAAGGSGTLPIARGLVVLTTYGAEYPIRSLTAITVRSAGEKLILRSAVGSNVRLAAGESYFETVGDMDVADEPPWMASRRVSK